MSTFRQTAVVMGLIILIGVNSRDQYYRIYYHSDDHCEKYVDFNQSSADHRWSRIGNDYPKIMLLDSKILKIYGEQKYVDICYNEAQKDYEIQQS